MNLHRTRNPSFARAVPLLVLVVASCMGCYEYGSPGGQGAAPKPTVEDPALRSWCGGEVCGWSVLSGRTEKAPTWHPDEPGVELVEPSTSLAYVANGTSKGCTLVQLVGDFAESAQVTVGIDYGNDGKVDVELPVVSPGFSPSNLMFAGPAKSYTNLRYVLTKKGTGRAVLALFDADTDVPCSKAPITLASP